jgi:predicted dehydrogenase
MRFGIVGLGWATQALLLPALRAQPATEIVGGCDVSEGARSRWERDTALRSFASLAELNDAARPEAVVIATPPASHAALCLEALDLGLHVICEKPLALSVAEAETVLASAAEAGRRVAVNHEFRCTPIFEAVGAALAQERFGRLVFCQMWQLMDLAPWDEPAGWRAAMADRALLEGGVHLIDLMLTLFGSAPEAIFARRSGGLDRGDDGDALQLLTLEFPDRRLGQITIDRLFPAASRYLELRADCERASLRASVGGRACLRVGKKRAERTGLRLELASGGLAWVEQGLTRRTIARNPRDAPARATSALLVEIVAALQEGREPPSSGREARSVLGVIEAAYESARTGERVELRSILDPEPIGRR